MADIKEMYDGHRNDAGVLDVRDPSTFVNHSSDVVGYERVHSGARDGENRSRSLPSRTYWLKEWDIDRPPKGYWLRNKSLANKN